jgi:phosphopantothenoylcysteine synthetase/decarboxylase
MNQPKNIVLGVTGSIAAYKAADLTSLLTKAGCAVNVVMTADAQRFITPLPFKTLSRNPVITDLYDEEEGWKPTHVRLADEADLLLLDLHRACAESTREVDDCAGYERENVVAPRDSAER